MRKVFNSLIEGGLQNATLNSMPHSRLRRSIVKELRQSFSLTFQRFKQQYFNIGQPLMSGVNTPVTLRLCSGIETILPLLGAECFADE